MKKFEISLALSIVFCLAAVLFQIPFSVSCNALRDDTLRLHVVANSDSEADQTVKLAVRDALLEASGDWLAEAEGRDSAAKAAAAHTADIENIAAGVLAQNGFEYDVCAYVTDMYFEQRTYGDITLPAGIYRALRVELGAAEGKNWWCVVYPSLCVPAATEEELEAALAAYSEEEREIILGGESYVFKFKFEEWLQKLLQSGEA